MPSVLDLFNQNEVLNYQQNREYTPLLGATLFPEVKKQSLEFDLIKGAGRTPVVASVHSFDTEAEIGSREASKMALEAALIKRKMQLTEKEIVALESPRNTAEQQYLMQNVYNDVDVLVAGVNARVEQMRMEVLAKGTLTLAENGLDIVIPYNVPDENQEALSGTDLWTDPAAKPIEDMIRWATGMAITPTRVLTSNSILAAILTNPNVKSAIFGTGSGRILSVGELNTFLESMQLPKIATYDAKFRKQNPNGTYTTHRYFPSNAFVMFGDGALGETLFGPTAEEIRLTRDPSIETSKIGNVLAMVYEENVDPVSTWTKAVATAIPSFPAADEVFQAQPIA